MILRRCGLRQLSRHPLQLLFAVLGVALGVAVVVAIDLANASAERAFRLSARALAGRATHQVVGGPGGLEETVYRQLRLQAEVRSSAPVVEGYVAVPTEAGLTLELLGIDPFAEPPFRDYSPAAADPEADLGRFLTEPGGVLLLPATAGRLGLAIGDELAVQVGGLSRTLVLVGHLAPRQSIGAEALAALAVTDIATAQELLGTVGRLSRIDLQLPEGQAGEELLARVRPILPPSALIVPANTRGQAMDQMTRAFRLNLSALSLLALVVGMFLIYNTMTFTVLRWRQTLGTLRTLGVTRQEIFTLVLGQAALVGVAGTLLGLLLGWGLATGLVQLVTRTINDLYFVVNVRQVEFSPLVLGRGALLGLVASLLSALVPAREAAAAPAGVVLSRSALEHRQRRLLPRISLVGGLLLVLGAGLLLLPGRSVPLAFVALFALIAGYALLTPGMAVLLLRLLQPPLGRWFGLLGRMAPRTLSASLSRTGVATAALVVAVSATIGVGLMVDSFRATVERWLADYLRADVYLTTAPSGFQAGRVALDPKLPERVAQTPGVTAVTRASHLTLQTATEAIDLFVVDLPAPAFAGYRFAAGDRQAIYQSVQAGAVIVSEPFAWHHRLQPGDTLRLPTARGEVAFAIAGVFDDYSSSRGRVVMEWTVYQTHWPPLTADSLGIYLAPGVDPEAAAAELRRQSAGVQEVVVRSNRALRQLSLATFDRTFAVTAVLRLLAVLIAFVGILNALTALQVERARELAVLRACGLTPGRLWLLASGETGLIGLLAGLLSLPLGILQALVLIWVINRRSFGWTMPLQLSPEILLQAVGLALVAALAAGLVPAWRMARTSPALALREE
ncbi:MAG: ABC transporter permease [Desulfuromonadales bacterium]|nr:ABC transporter permease [Desulfuromonadales bacterium]